MIKFWKSKSVINYSRNWIIFFADKMYNFANPNLCNRPLWCQTFSGPRAFLAFKYMRSRKLEIKVAIPQCNLCDQRSNDLPYISIKHSGKVVTLSLFKNRSFSHFFCPLTTTANYQAHPRLGQLLLWHVFRPIKTSLSQY